MNLREIIDNDVDLDARLRQADTEVLETLGRIIDVEATLAAVKQAAKVRETSKPPH